MRCGTLHMAKIRTQIAQANAQDHAAIGNDVQRDRILGEGAVSGGVQGCLVLCHTEKFC